MLKSGALLDTVLEAIRAVFRRYSVLLGGTRKFVACMNVEHFAVDRYLIVAQRCDVSKLFAVNPIVWDEIVLCGELGQTLTHFSIHISS